MPNLTYPYSIVAGDTPIAGRVQGNFDAIKTLLESTKLDASNIQPGAITQALLDAALLQALGIGVSARGKSIIATEETRSNTAYGLLTTPDRVSSVVLPSNGLICVDYQALVKSSVSAAGRAAIFIAGNQLTVQAQSGVGGFNGPVVQASKTQGTNYHPTFSVRSGLAGADFTGSETAAASDVTTGQALGAIPFATGHMDLNNGTELTTASLGGTCLIKAAAGTYDITVQFKATSGSVSAKERSLWVAAVAY